MIIKGIFRRYERWNPVHPTYGAFWGMGVGIGCGVGWGPGFGPEVIGYVGAGCGVGFSVGFTLAGVGVGLPMNGLLAAPYNAFIATRNSVFDPLGSNGLFSKDPATRGRNSWQNRIALHISVLQREASEKFSHFKPELKRIDMTDMKNKVAVGTSFIWEGLGRFGNEVFRPQKGSK